jgi:glycosyltransferase involved in cell wall biosynthesis
LWIYPAVPRDATAFNWKRKRDAYGASTLFVAAPCRWLADRVRRSMLMPGVRELRVIPYGVNLDVFGRGDRAAARAELGLDSGRPMFLFFANSLRARSWKDSAAFRGALERLPGDGAAAGAQWIALGESGPDEQVGPVRVRHMGLESDDRRLRRWYHAADAYVHPALADTFPNMVIESLACGTPVIATAVGGIPEQVISADGIAGAAADAGLDRATGAIVPGGDPAALAAALEGFLALDPAARAALGANAARDARARFDRRRQEREYLAWMHELVDARALRAGNAGSGRP